MKLFSFFTIFQVHSYEILNFESKPPGNRKSLDVTGSDFEKFDFFQCMVVGQNGKIGVHARYFQSIVRASFQIEREHANVTIAIIIVLERSWSEKSVRAPTDIAWVKMNGYHA